MDFPTYENPTAYHAQAVLDNTDLKALSVAPAFTGVASGCVVSANATMGVAIASGTILINGVSRTTAGGTSVVSAASVGDRRDIIYATWSGSAVVFTTAAGTPATAGWTFGTQGTPPIKPTLPDNAVLLAEVYVVGSGATPTTVITSSAIVDKRCIVALDATKLPLAGGTMSGAIAMGSNKITGLATATATGDAVSYAQWVGQTLTPVVKTISNTATAGDFVVMNGSGNTTTTLPAAPANGTMVGLVNVGTGTASILAGGSDTIRGSTTSGASVSSSQYQTLVVIYNSASSVWEPVVADANKGYTSRTNTWVGVNTFSNTVTNNGLTVMGPTASVTGPSVTAKQPVQTATITNVTASAGTVTYTAVNSFTAGNLVTITGVSPAGYNLSSQTIATASATQFTVTNAATGTYVSGGTATSFSSGQYALQVQNANGAAVFQTGALNTNTTNLTEALNHTGSSIRVAGSNFIGTLSLQNYNSGNLPGLSIYQNSANTGDLVSLRTTSTNTVLRANTSGAWITGGGATSFVVRAVQNTASITAILGNGTTITVTANNYFSVGQTVVITGTTNYNGTYTIATATGSSFTITSATTGATSTGTATTTGQTADVLQVQDSSGTALLGVSNTGSAGSPVWAVNAYSNKVTGVANGTNPTDAVNYGQISPLGMAGKNFVINGAMDFWQRGTSFSSGATACTADRWYAWGGFTTSGAFTVTQNNSIGATGFQNAARVQRVNGSTNTTAVSFGQSMETAVSLPAAGQSVVFSFWARAGANFSASSSWLSATLLYGTGVDQNVALSYTGSATVVATNAVLTTSWQRFGVIGTVPANASEMALQFSYTPTGTAGANDWFEVTGVQVELGSVLTNFSRAGGHPAGEFALCQRYYQVLGNGDLQGQITTASTTVAMWARYNVPMRVAASSVSTTSTPSPPSIGVSSLTTNVNLFGVGPITPTTNWSLSTASTTNLVIYTSVSSGAVNSYVNWASGNVIINAELY